MTRFPWHAIFNHQTRGLRHFESKATLNIKKHQSFTYKKHVSKDSKNGAIGSTYQAAFGVE
jgi:hypothetical protein